MRTARVVWVAIALISAGSQRLVFALTGTAVWTGQGTDDRWANPDNWEGGLLPGPADDVAFYGDPSFWENHPECHRTVTIDAPAQANKLSFYLYGYLVMPFSRIRIQPGASFVVGDEHIDQSNAGPPGYSQTGGTHEVLADYSYTSWRGHFEMTDGLFKVGGTLSLRPEVGSVSITGGTIEAGTLSLRTSRSGYTITDNSTLLINRQLTIGGDLGYPGARMSVAGNVHMRGADFVNEFLPPFQQAVELEGMDLFFEGGTSSSSTLEVAGADLGADLIGLQDNYALGSVRIGDSSTANVGLVNDLVNQGGISEALYLHHLAVDSGSLLDLRGLPVYAADSVTFGGTTYLGGSGQREFLPGQHPGLYDSVGGGKVILIPEPAVLSLLLLGGLLMIRRKG